ncbi:MAG: hypothetical protein Q7K65_04260 [Candidatus Buchananbacteria bacterium]|nr:hypothetical protein [Candidatus Buchananbacteria bacterium]
MNFEQNFLPKQEVSNENEKTEEKEIQQYLELNERVNTYDVQADLLMGQKRFEDDSTFGEDMKKLEDELGLDNNSIDRLRWEKNKMLRKILPQESFESDYKSKVLKIRANILENATKNPYSAIRQLQSELLSVRAITDDHEAASKIEELKKKYLEAGLSEHQISQARLMVMRHWASGQ